MKKRIRFFAYEMRDGVWVAHCVDFSLAAQADSFPAVQEKLHAQLVDYCAYINSQSADPVYQRQLLNRRAPLGTRVWYWIALIAQKLSMRVKPSAVAPPRSWTESTKPLAC